MLRPPVAAPEPFDSVDALEASGAPDIGDAFVAADSLETADPLVAADPLRTLYSLEAASAPETAVALQAASAPEPAGALEAADAPAEPLDAAAMTPPPPTITPNAAAVTVRPPLITPIAPATTGEAIDSARALAREAAPDMGSGRPSCTLAQMRRFIKSRPYVPLHELRRRFEIGGIEDEVSRISTGDRTVFVGLPQQEATFLGELVSSGEVGYELLLDPTGPAVIGVFPMRPVARQ